MILISIFKVRITCLEKRLVTRALSKVPALFFTFSNPVFLHLFLFSVIFANNVFLFKSFPGTPLRPRLPHSREPRRCTRCVIAFCSATTDPKIMTRCTYLVEYKLAKGQLREIEDFIDRGQKSLFLGELLSSISKSTETIFIKKSEVTI